MSAYTYAVEFTAPIAEFAGAESLVFDASPTNPVPILYVDNFLDFEVGGVVPIGAYDRGDGVWQASDDGRVIEILSRSGGTVTVDTDGDAMPDDGQDVEPPITSAERAALFDVYTTAPVQVWRSPITHFSTWDKNWAWGLPPDAKEPPDEEPEDEEPEECTFSEAGSIIECETQTLGESLGVVGTPFSLSYRSDRVVDRESVRSVRVRVVPDDWETLRPEEPLVRVSLDIAGRRLLEELRPGDTGGSPINGTDSAEIDCPLPYCTITWNGVDLWGRFVNGRQEGIVTVTYEYQPVYRGADRGSANQFGRNFNLFATLETEARYRNYGPVRLTRRWPVSVGAFLNPVIELGGWSIDEHHAFDPDTGTVYRGDGGERRYRNIPATAVVSTAAESGEVTWGFEVGPDEAIYLVAPRDTVTAGAYHGAVLRFEPDGASSSEVLTDLGQPTDVALGSDGALYVVDRFAECVLRLAPDGTTVETVLGVCGTSIPTFGSTCSPNPPDVEHLCQPNSVEVGRDGSVFVSDFNRILRRLPGGDVEVYADLSRCPWPGDQSFHPRGLSVGEDGSVYAVEGPAIGPFYIPPYAETGGHLYRVLRVRPDGVCLTLAGGGTISADEEGVVATETRLEDAIDLQIMPDGRFYFTERARLDAGRIRMVNPDLLVYTIGGLNPEPVYVPGMLFRRVPVQLPVGIELGPDGASLYYSMGPTGEVRRVARPTIGIDAATDDYRLPSPDGSRVWVFNRDGRHVRTESRFTGDWLFEFTYTTAGLLNHIYDRDGRETTVERDPVTGRPIAIVAPYGQTTSLEVDTNGYLSEVEEPGGQTHTFTYTTGGLLTSWTPPYEPAADPPARTYTYETSGSPPTGRLITAEDPDDGSTPGRVLRLERTSEGSGYAVSRWTDYGCPDPEGTSCRMRRHEVSTDAVEGRTYTVVAPGGLETETRVLADRTTTTTRPDGTTTEVRRAPAPETGILAPLTSLRRIETPSHLVHATTVEAPAGGHPMDRDVSVNGRVYRTRYLGDEEVVFTSPEGRETRIVDRRPFDIEVQRTGWPTRTSVYHTSGPHYGRLWLTLEDPSTSGAWRETRFFYDDLGRLQRINDALDRPPPAEPMLEFAYDDGDRLISITHPDGRLIDLVSNRAGSVTELTPPGAEPHTFDYTPIQLPSNYVPPDIGGNTTTTLHYTPDRELDAVDRPSPLPDLDLVYEESTGRLDYVERDEGLTPNPLWDIVYDSAGRVEQLTYPGGADASFAYDCFLLQSVTWSEAVAGCVAYQYDQVVVGTETRTNFWIDETSVNGGSEVCFEYDDDGLLDAVGVPSGGSCNVVLDLLLDDAAGQNSGRLLGTTLDQVSTSITHTGFAELDVLDADFGTSGDFGLTYHRDDDPGVPGDDSVERDALGRIAYIGETLSYHCTTPECWTATDCSGSLCEHTSQRWYTYDAADRLQAVWLVAPDVDPSCTDPDVVECYEYDANGNRVFALNSAGTVTVDPANVDAQDRLLEYDDWAYTYDAEGTLVERCTPAATCQDEEPPAEAEIWTYTYDAFGDLIEVDIDRPGTVDDVTVTYVIDALGRRVGRQVDGSWTHRWVYDGPLNPIAELHATGDVSTRFVYASRGNVPDYMVLNGITYRFVTDHLGSVRLVVRTDTGAVWQRLDYDAWGRVLVDTNPGFQPFGFAGGLYDEVTGLVRFGARDYDPEVGRWTAKDPILFGGGDTNLYAYVGNDPVNRIDPWGLQALGCFDEGSDAFTDPGVCADICQSERERVRWDYDLGGGVICVADSLYCPCAYDPYPAYYGECPLVDLDAEFHETGHMTTEEIVGCNDPFWGEALFSGDPRAGECALWPMDVAFLGATLPFVSDPLCIDIQSRRFSDLFERLKRCR